MGRGRNRQNTPINRRHPAEAVAAVTISSEFLAVYPGDVCGIIQDGVGYRKNEPVVPPATWRPYLGCS